MTRKEMMGRVVMVSKVLEKSPFGSDVRSWMSVVVPRRPGWVVGFRTLKNGKTLETEFGNEFVATGQVPCIQVCYSPASNSVRVPMDGWELTEEEPYYLTERERSVLSVDAQSYDRDELGRFKR